MNLEQIKLDGRRIEAIGHLMAEYAHYAIVGDGQEYFENEIKKLQEELKTLI